MIEISAKLELEGRGLGVAPSEGRKGPGDDNNFAPISRAKLTLMVRHFESVRKQSVTKAKTRMK